MAKPNGKKRAPNFNGLKAARAECRQKCAQSHRPWWPLCWNKVDGYYCPDYDNGNRDFICFVDKSGTFTCATDEVLRVHNLKGHIRPAWWYYSHK